MLKTYLTSLDFNPKYCVMKTLFTLTIFLVAFTCSIVGAETKRKGLENPSFSNTEIIAQPEANDFVGSFTMNITEYKNGKPSKSSPMKINLYFKGDLVAFVPTLKEGQYTTMIYNLKEKSVTTLIDQEGEKTGMKMKIPGMLLKEEEKDKFDFTITPTDEQKTIAGYSCRKYLTESVESSGYVWVTEEIDLDYSRVFEFLNIEKKKSNNSMSSLRDLKGFALEAYSKNKEKDEAYEMKISDLNIGKVNEEIFDISEYTITDMSSMMNFGGGE